MNTVPLIKSKPYFAPLVAGVLGLSLVLAAASRYGIGLSADSVTYIAVAERFGAGKGFTSFDGNPLLVFPPLFSALVAVLTAVGLQASTAALFINAISLGLIVFLSTNWLIKHTGSVRAGVLGASALLLSVALIEVSVYAWTEPLFIVFALLTLLQFEQLESGSTFKAPILAGLCAALACLTRYAGITLIITGALLLLLQRPASLARTLKQITVFLIVAVGPLALWLLRNYLASSTLTGDRVLSKVSALTAFYQACSIISLWFLPKSVPVRLRLVLIGLFVLAVAILLVAAAFKYKLWRLSDAQRALRPFLLFIGVYVAFMVFTTATTALSPIDNRYMSPIYPPLILTVVYATSKIAQLYSGKVAGRHLSIILAASALVWMLYPAYTASTLVRSYLSEGAGGFHSRAWMTSELLDYLKTNKLEGSVYSNEPYAVYALTGKLYKGSPRKFKYESRTTTGDLSEFSRQLHQHGFVYMVWFDTSWWEDYLYSAHDLGALYKMEPVVTKKDGTIFMVRPRGGN